MHSHEHSPNSAAHTVETHATSPYKHNSNNTAAPIAQHLDPLSRRRFSNNAAPTVQHEVPPNAISSHQSNPNDTAAPVAQHHAPFSCHHSSNNETPIVQHGAAHEVQPNAAPSHQCIPTNVLPTVRHDAAQEVQPNAARAKPVQPQVGMNVILYGILRSDAPVALGTIISTNPKSIIGGVALGKQYCEVVVNHVLKKDATLPRTYPGVEKMADAHHLSIAWPYNKVTNYLCHLFLFPHI
jgi:hypothetical protein